MIEKPTDFNIEREIEMAQILHQFITSNEKLFSKAVRDAAMVLYEEIKKLEESKKNNPQK